MWSQTKFSKSRTCIKYLLTKVGLPVTKEVQDVCLKLSPSDELVAVIHKAMARPASLKILALQGCQFGLCQKRQRMFSRGR